jgi:hypothetical protein
MFYLTTTPWTLSIIPENKRVKAKASSCLVFDQKLSDINTFLSTAFSLPYGEAECGALLFLFLLVHFNPRCTGRDAFFFSVFSFSGNNHFLKHQSQQTNYQLFTI